MKKARLIALLMTLCMATACFLSGTVAKYTSTSTGTGTYDIAKWAFTVNGENITTSNTFTINLGETFDNDNDTPPDAADAEVKEDMIAPGTKGSFPISLTNASEVDATYGIVFDLSVADIPFIFSVSEDGGAFELVGNLAALNARYASVEIEQNETVNLVIKWTWAYSAGNDTIDTNIGIAAVTNNDLNITATVTATQAE